MPSPGYLTAPGLNFPTPQPPLGAGPLVPVAIAGPGRKQSGLGMMALVGGYDLSGEIMSLSKISGGANPLDVTPISKSAHVRLLGQRDGAIDFDTAFDPAAGHSHPVLALLPRTDVQVMVGINLAVGGEAACEIAKQVDYNPTRQADAMLSSTVSSVANGFGLEWGKLLTAGQQTITAPGPTPTAAYDSGASLAFGAQAYVQVTGFTGTDATVAVADSADTSSWAPVTGLTFAQTTAANTTQRVATSNTAVVRRYLGVTVSTVGGFTSLTFAVAVNKNLISGQTF